MKKIIAGTATIASLLVAGSESQATTYMRHALDCTAVFDSNYTSTVAGVNSVGQVYNGQSSTIDLICPLLGDGTTPSSATVYGYANSAGMTISTCTTYYTGSSPGGACTVASNQPTPGQEFTQIVRDSSNWTNSNFNYLKIAMPAEVSGSYNVLFGYASSE